MDAKIIQEFKGSINDIEINERDIYYECEYILGEIECILGIELPTSFIRDFIHVYENVYLTIEPEYAFELRSNIINSWDQDIDNIKELQFDISELDDPRQYFKDINSKVKDWDNTYGKYPNNLNLKK